MKTTDEQQEIINSKAKFLIVNALSGVGKTTTLVEWAKARPKKKILYLVFGKSMAEEAKEMFKGLYNVEVRTTHSIAYKYYGFKYRDKLTFNYGVIDCLHDLDLKKDYDVAYGVLELFNRFLASNSYDLVEFVQTTLRDRNMKNEYKIKSLTKLCCDLWAKSLDIKSPVKITHDFYLKLFHLSKADLGRTHDVIICDEGQDLTMLIKGILDNSNCDKVIVGDVNQSIYAWRHCVNLLELYPKATVLELTKSFRVNQQVADMCSRLIKEFKHKKIKMTGLNPNQKVYSQKGINLGQRVNGRWNIITRTNATLLAHAIEGMLHGKSLYFEGGVKSYPLQYYKDLYWFRATNKTYNRDLAKYGSWEQLNEFVKETEDIDLSCAINVINIYSKKLEAQDMYFPDAIDEIYAHVVKEKERADLCFCTAHKSKGLTFTESVFIESDFINLKDTTNSLCSCTNERDLKMVLTQISQDINLLYVALTRAKGNLYVNDDVATYFGIE